jgi:hypothetical protein
MGATEAFTATTEVGHYIQGRRVAGPRRSTTRRPVRWRARSHSRRATT